MKTQFTIINFFITFILFSFFINNVGILRCENISDSIEVQFNVKFVERRVEEKYDSEQQNEKGERYEKMEWLIKQDIMKQYERMEVKNLEDSLD